MNESHPTPTGNTEVKLLAGGNQTANGPVQGPATPSAVLDPWHSVAVSKTCGQSANAVNAPSIGRNLSTR